MSQIRFPLELKIERNDAPESFSMPDDISILSIHPTPPRYHVTAVLLDVERRRTVSYEFWSMVDPSRGPYEDVGRITHVPTSAQVGRLRALRDALNEVLGDPTLDSEDWERVLDWNSIAYGEGMVDDADERTAAKITNLEREKR